MSEFVIDYRGDEIWYDLSSYEFKSEHGINHYVKLLDGTFLYVRRHREHGPAVIYKSRRKEWYNEGKLHREDGPAIIWSDGSEEYYTEGKLHREDGPAIISRKSKYIYWYFKGYEYSFDYWCKNLEKSPEEIIFLKLKWNIV